MTGDELAYVVDCLAFGVVVGLAVYGILTGQPPRAVAAACAIVGFMLYLRLERR